MNLSRKTLQEVEIHFVTRKRFRAQESVKKSMLIFICDMKRPISIDFHEERPTVNSFINCQLQNSPYILIVPCIFHWFSNMVFVYRGATYVDKNLTEPITSPGLQLFWIQILSSLLFAITSLKSRVCSTIYPYQRRKEIIEFILVPNVLVLCENQAG